MPIMTDHMQYLSSFPNSESTPAATRMAFERDASCLRLMIIMFTPSVDALRTDEARFVAAVFG
jgi:hypothetical protein